MKRTIGFLGIVLFLLIGAALLNVCLSKPAVMTVQAQSTPAINDDCNKDRSVQVSGTAVVNVAPDRVLIQLGVETNGTTPDAVRSENATAIQRVINAIKAVGVETKDIATDYYIVEPVYENYSTLFIKGYKIDNTISVTVRNVNSVSQVIVDALKAGANEVQDIQFFTSELRKYRDQARDLAVKAASEKALALAKTANAQTGCVLSITETSMSHYYGSWRGGRDNSALWSQNAMQNVASQGSALQPVGDDPISLGQIAVQAQVNVSYSLK
jgi:uncharacterized protein